MTYFAIIEITKHMTSLLEQNAAACGMYMALKEDCETSESAWIKFKEKYPQYIPKYWSGGFCKAFVHGWTMGNQGFKEHKQE